MVGGLPTGIEWNGTEISVGLLYGIWKSPEWIGMEDSKKWNGRQSYQFHTGTRFRTWHLQNSIP